MPERRKARFTYDRPMYMTSGLITRDPEPYIVPMHHYVGDSYTVAYRSMSPTHDSEYAPRPEFDNHDPIIASFRGLYGRATPAIRANAAVHYLASVRDMGIAIGMSKEQRDHSRRILRLLAGDLAKDEPMASNILAQGYAWTADQFDLMRDANANGRAESAEAARLEGRIEIPAGRLWEREAERSARFDDEGFDSFTEITAHAALAREAFERTKKNDTREN